MCKNYYFLLRNIIVIKYSGNSLMDKQSKIDEVLKLMKICFLHFIKIVKKTPTIKKNVCMGN